jgi:prevent-host-death family protein
MLTVNYSRLRANLKDYCDKAADEGEPVLVTRRGGNVVILSADQYSELIKGSRDRESGQIRVMSTYIRKLSELLEKNGVRISVEEEEDA